MIDDDVRKIRGVVKEEIQVALEPVKEDIGTIKKDVKELREDVDIVKKDVKELREDVDALRGDVASLQDQTKAIWDKIDLGHKRNKREIDEIKTHLALPLMPDTPEF